jgi:D-alanyl-lipoteichoic acid acyltransferase DltB (MBOAT superfamily)
MISLNSLIFTGVLFLAPLLLNHKLKFRNWIFLVINLSLLLLSMNSLLQVIITLLWILLPYFLSSKLKKPHLLIGVLVLGFIYLNRYDWIISTLGIPYLLPFKLLGLSYILFRQIDFILNRSSMDRKNINLVHYLNYLLSFYTFLAGPIMKYETFVEDLNHPQDPKDIDVLKELHRAFNGYIKVFVLSAIFSMIALSAYKQLLVRFDFLTFIGLAVTNVLFIYFNFSGYCDVMISLGKLSGFKIDENFNKPYLAGDLSEFWSRWHMTLTRWLTNYVFNPIVVIFARSEKLSIEKVQVLAFFITFLVAGLWHGTMMNFLIYGLLQGLGVSLSKLITDYRIKRLGGRKAFRVHRQKPLVKAIEMTITLTYVSLSFLFFSFDVLALWKV